MLDYRVVRSNRKTSCIQINNDLEIIVRCPQKMNDKGIGEFVTKHSEWIQRNLENVKERMARKDRFKIAPGHGIPYLGSGITITPSQSTKAYIKGDKLLVPENAENIEPHVVSVLFGEANRIIPEIVKDWAKRMDLQPKRVTITQARTRWGSCSSSGSICFSYRLICAPMPLIEYVVVHELSHLAHHDHSAEFHAHVEKFLPDQRSRRILLRHFQRESEAI